MLPTQENIRKELSRPAKVEQFVFYLNDVSPISVYSKRKLKAGSMKGI